MRTTVMCYLLSNYYIHLVFPQYLYQAFSSSVKI
ncbi:unnamed protein product [Brassica napus]|uniref:(rape) hypothetical protein n=1 Tax=Brassica napus TaxID=3708 RepID=A0A816KNJ3_BRANA|nr:unnamed protein product [Brassica napus]